MILISTGRSLIWQHWDDVFVVYQPSSAETHVFNETTAWILRSLEQGPQTARRVKEAVELALGIGNGDLGANDFAFAVWRLEELGLLVCREEAVAA
ncbi:MAG TPA: HPr-rel-A system PqqD family peptide chaperone [Accumulibacter sp.]|uniref:HPr-rel-A system PqqD family peptide chaperone n=1 Tax=Accumulibacter sp. TaxID=2053492 RepID=UPI0025E341F5|nr:HPr-rel-A system PqqD family peptide chaperone [Accumulibacter sp.]MCM8600321.1 HPr-rel-A system PqqD family peptide chaperone [Accumulibacter sp.]MCM8664554.1 HPr-rel-A system PqqD family peptide chaperone [Accumulibacter sp.]HNC51428.1 HPr-rel-A system PqqD family peptide chaperone [Accumulibacter sp.]